MVTVRKSEERGHANYGWLDTHYSFSFNTYMDPSHVHFRKLRVINEDTVAGGGGFPPHEHDNMEIVTYVVQGALEHKDSTGGGGVIGRGDVQHMSAGTGVTHSEFNHSKTEPVHLLQIWIFPDKQGIKPGYEQKNFSDDAKRDRLLPIAASQSANGALPLHTDATVYASILEKGKSLTHELRPGRHAWVQLITGRLAVNGIELKAGDGASVSDEPTLKLEAGETAEFLLFDLG